MEAHSAQVVGNAFVEQYYHVLHQSPGLVHKFYQDISSVSRPDVDGSMTTVTTMQDINDKILSFNYEDYTAEIKTADSQDSYDKGVIVLVTGVLNGKDNVRKKFTQTFFLAPQDKGYFVLNDVLRYAEENESSLLNSVSQNGVQENSTVAPLASEPVHAPDSDPGVDNEVRFEEEDTNNGAEVCDPSDNEGSVVEDEVVPPNQSSHSEVIQSIESTSVAQENAPKKSYASIVKVMKTTAASTPVSTSTVKVAKTTKQQPLSSGKPAPASEAMVPTPESAPESSIVSEEAEGHSIYVRNLPYNANVAQLEEAFRKFGLIKPDGIQVRSNKQGFTFGFVEFETAASMQSALKASPITVGDREAVVEEKRTTTKVSGSGRGRGRGGLRSDSFRARGNVGGGRGYRSEFRNQNDFSGRPRGSSTRNTESYQRVKQSGNGRGGHHGGLNQNNVTS